MPVQSLTEINQLLDHLYISSARALNGVKLQELGITLVVSAIMEPPNCVFPPGVDNLRIVVTDSMDTDLSVYFDQVADKIEKVRQENGKSLVHCVVGASRSATLCLAYLMKYNKMTLREAYKFAKNIRPIICPNNGFFKQLIEYERSLYGKTTVEMVSVGDGFLIPDIYQENSKGFVWLKSIKGAIFGK